MTKLKKACAPRGVPDQAWHPPCPISVFAVCLKCIQWSTLLPCRRRRLRSDCPDAQADLNLLWAGMPLSWLCRVTIGVGRGGARGGGGPGPPNNLRGGANIPFAPPSPPPNNPPTFSFNFYLKQEKITMYQVEGFGWLVVFGFTAL